MKKKNKKLLKAYDCLKQKKSIFVYEKNHDQKSTWFINKKK